MHENAIEIQFKLHPTPRVRTSEEHTRVEITSACRRLPRVTQVLALAIHFQDMLGRGEAKGYSDLARTQGVTRERLSQIMKLIWLTPDIQQEILYLPPTGGRHPISEVAVRRVACSLSWADQRREWTALKAQHKLA